MYLQAIFEKQQELMNNYQKIEKNLTGETYSTEIDLDCPKYQAKLRQVAWWISEELAEADNAEYEGSKELYREELIDALHFMAELCILSGYTVEDVTGNVSNDVYFTHVKSTLGMTILISGGGVKNHIRAALSHALGMTINQLKNKPWKQTPKMTNRDEYRMWMERTFKSFIALCIMDKMDSPNILLEEYMKKHQVNTERQAGGY